LCDMGKSVGGGYQRKLLGVKRLKKKKNRERYMVAGTPIGPLTFVSRKK